MYGTKRIFYSRNSVYANTDCADDADMHRSIKIRPLIKRRACKACPIPCKLRFQFIHVIRDVVLVIVGAKLMFV